MTTAPTNDMLALADRLKDAVRNCARDSHYKYCVMLSVPEVEQITSALRLAATPSARDVREACARLVETTECYGATPDHPGVSYTSTAWRKQIGAAIRAIELSALSNLDAAAPAAGGDAQWPDPKVTNPDIANPTGNPYIDCLLHRLLDAQQDINFHANSDMNQSLADAAALIDEVETAIRKLAAPPLQAPAHSDAGDA
jgi:hypothetical protein